MDVDGIALDCTRSRATGKDDDSRSIGVKNKVGGKRVKLDWVGGIVEEGVPGFLSTSAQKEPRMIGAARP